MQRGNTLIVVMSEAKEKTVTTRGSTPVTTASDSMEGILRKPLTKLVPSSSPSLRKLSSARGVSRYTNDAVDSRTVP